MEARPQTINPTIYLMTLDEFLNEVKGQVYVLYATSTDGIISHDIAVVTGFNGTGRHVEYRSAIGTYSVNDDIKAKKVFAEGQETLKHINAELAANGKRIFKGIVSYTPYLGERYVRKQPPIPPKDKAKAHDGEEGLR